MWVVYTLKLFCVWCKIKKKEEDEGRRGRRGWRRKGRRRRSRRLHGHLKKARDFSSFCHEESLLWKWKKKKKKKSLISRFVTSGIIVLMVWLERE